MNALALAVALTLALGWAFDPNASRAEFDAPRRPIVREPIPLGVLHGPNGSIRVEGTPEGLRYRVFDARGNHAGTIRDHADPDDAFDRLGSPDPRHGFAGVVDLDLPQAMDP